MLSKRSRKMSTTFARVSSRSARFSATKPCTSRYASGSKYLNARSSSSHLNRPIPRRFARGAKISRVSRAMLWRLSADRCSRVRMLWSRSASLTTITRMSCAIAKNMRRKFSACRSVLLEKLNLESLVTPSTKCRTSAPNACSNSSGVTSVSSITSWSKPAATIVALPPK